MANKIKPTCNDHPRRPFKSRLNCSLRSSLQFFTYIVPNKMTLLEAEAAPESLIIMLYGALLALPILIAYTAFAYYIFRGKATDLGYD